MKVKDLNPGVVETTETANEEASKVDDTASREASNETSTSC